MQHIKKKKPRNIHKSNHISQFNGLESEQTPGCCEGRGSLVCCSSWTGYNLVSGQQKQQII